MLPTSNAARVPAIFTEINLISGDVVTLVHETFKEPNDPVAKMHTEQVKNGQEIVSQNINTIIKLAESGTEAVKNMLARDARKS